MNPFRIIYYHLYLLQLENYDVARYARALIKRPLPSRELRQKIVWTAKIKTILAMSMLLCLLFLLTQNIFWITLAFILFFCAPLFFIVIATLLLLPLDIFLKRRIIAQAQKKLAQFPNLKIIAITGSYGKTTMKEILAAILAEQFTVLKTPDNINTPVGIARLIIEKVTPHIQIFIVEMGAYQKGDIKMLCALTPPDISILTGINEAHLERFGNIENTIAAKFEIIDYARPNAVIILNADNEYIIKEWQKHAAGKLIYFYSAHNASEARYRIENIRYAENGMGMSFKYTDIKNTAYKIKTALLGEYAAKTIMGAVIAAEELNIPKEKIIHRIALIRPLPHRLEPIITKQGVLIIDDSYNGNSTGVTEAIRVLSRFKNKRKIYVTPGLVETGKHNQIIHQKIGEQLAAVADLVILIKNSATIHIAEGLRAAQFKNENIIWFKNTLDAHAALAGILHSGDVILFQNDWPDNYF